MLPDVEQPDAALVAAAQQGDRTAMERLLRRHHPRITAVCRRLTGNDADAADAAQEAMILIVRNIGRFDGRSSFGTWAYRVATNSSLDELRRRRRRSAEPLDDAALPERSVPDAGEILGDRDLLTSALAALPEEFRVPVVLRDVADLDYAEIAEVLSIPVGTVKSRIARARAQLAALLGNHEGRPGRPTSGPDRP